MLLGGDAGPLPGIVLVLIFSKKLAGRECTCLDSLLRLAIIAVMSS